MNATYQAAFNAQLEALTRKVDIPSDRALGYGIDLSCVTDLTFDMAEVDPYTPTAIAEAQARRLQTGRGQLIYDLTYGTDVRGMLNRGYTESQLATLDTEIYNELRKDDRISDTDVTVDFEDRETLRVTAISTPVDQVESFNLTFWVTDGEIIIDQLG